MKTPAKLLPLDRLVEADWNANRVSPGMLAKVRRSIERYGVVENLVARPHPERPGQFELLSGNHRLRVLRELGHKSAPVVVVELGDAEARLLAQTLNRTRGVDDPEAYAALLERTLAELDVSVVSGLLPESEATIDRVLREYGHSEAEQAVQLELPAEPRSKPGELYELGPHRLLCGDGTNPEHVRLLMDGESAALMATDPPYGIRLDHGWRDRLRQPAGSARAGQLEGDDRCDWTEAYALTNAPVCYVWHAALFGGVVQAGLVAAGFEVR